MKNVSYYRHLHPESLKKLVAITKITAVSLLTVLPSTMQAEPTYSQSVVISIKTERMLLTDLFSQIEKQSEFLFFYVDKDVADIKVNIKANSNQIDEILTQALTGTGLIRSTIGISTLCEKHTHGNNRPSKSRGKS